MVCQTVRKELIGTELDVDFPPVQLGNVLAERTYTSVLAKSVFFGSRGGVVACDP